MELKKETIIIHLQLTDEDGDLQSHLLVTLHHQVVDKGGPVDPVHHQNIHILHPEQGLGQLLHPGGLTAYGPAGSERRSLENRTVPPHNEVLIVISCSMRLHYD